MKKKPNTRLVRRASTRNVIQNHYLNPDASFKASKVVGKQAAKHSFKASEVIPFPEHKKPTYAKPYSEGITRKVA